MKPIYAGVNKAPKVFGLSVATINELAKRGKIAIRKSGSASLLKVEEVENMLDASISLQ